MNFSERYFSMIKVKRFDSEKEMRDFVVECDKEFYVRLHALSEKIAADTELNIIGLTGPTCSGKTTMANILTEVLEERGKRVHVISLDDFFFDTDRLNRMSEDGSIDYDSPDTIDIDKLTECVDAIFSHSGSVVLPKFDFLTGKRIEGETIEAGEDDIFIFEGIQVVYPRVVSLLGKYDAYKCIYICPQSELFVNGKAYSSNDIRFLRRLVRDYRFRGADPDFSMYLWKSVRKNEEVHIFPNAKNCHYFVDSTMGYDINMLAPELEKILRLPYNANSGISEKEYKKTCEDILSGLAGIQKMYPEYLIEGSLYREFI